MQETMWSDLGDQAAANQRGNTLTYMVANAALTATVVFGRSGRLFISVDRERYRRRSIWDT